MFRLSDSTRRQATTGLFFLFCVVPTVVVVVIGIWRCLPGRIADEERRLTLLLGQPVRIETFRHLRPDAALYEGIELLDAETGDVLLQCDRLRIQFEWVRAEGQQTPHRQLGIRARTVTANALSTDPLRPITDRLLQRRIEGAPTHVDFAAQQLVLDNGPSDFHPRQVRAQVELSPLISRLEVNLQLKGQPAPALLCLVRNRECQPAVKGFELNTLNGPMPCSLLATVMPPFPDLGPNSQFQGRIVGNHVPQGCHLKEQRMGPEGWQLNLEGNLLDIDVSKFAGNHIPHAISGTGSLWLETMAFRAGRISDMRGSLRAANGRISQALVASCKTELGLTGSIGPLDASPALLPYDRLAFDFELDGSGLTVTGMCPSEPVGTILVGKYRLRLIGPVPTFGPIPFTKAVAAVTSTSEDRLAIPLYGSRLMQRLPILPSATATIAARQATVRPAARH